MNRCSLAVISRGLLLCSMLLVLSPLEGFAKMGGYLNFQFLCFKNPNHKDVKGFVCDSLPTKNCDPYFNICISNKPIYDNSASSCPVLHLETPPYDNEESVCNLPIGSDNRKSLIKIPDIDLPYPLSEIYYVRIVVMDSDFNSYQNIATFYSDVLVKPSQNFNEFQNTEIIMRREETKLYNREASMKISMGLRCDRDLYGSHCGTFCRHSKNDNYECSKEGEKICKPGWRGPSCLKRDFCEALRCAKGAQCIHLNNSAKCICDEPIGLKCYADYNPCHPNPCKNGGRCVERKDFSGGMTCNCDHFYRGSRCEEKFQSQDLCEIEPCRNNGSCNISANGNRHCICPPNFGGFLCDLELAAPSTTEMINASIGVYGLITDIETKTANYGFILGLLFISVIAVVSAIITYFLIKRRKNLKNRTLKREEINMKNISDLPSTKHVSNDYGTYHEETTYDTIEESKTYVCLEDDNDDYLVPSRPITPVITPSGRSDTSDYVPMFHNDETYISDDITHMNTRENEGLPPLPTRTPTKKTLNLFRNMKL